MLHRLFQNHHYRPDEVYQLPWRYRKFMYASESLVMEAESKLAKKGGNK